MESPPTDEEIRRARETILNSFVFNYDTRRKVLAQQIAYAYHGLPADYLERYRENLEKVTREEVARVAREYIHPDRFTLLVVGRSADFDRPVDTLGPLTVLDISIPPPPAPPKAEATAVAAAEGRLLHGRLAEAVLGGRAPLAGFTQTSTLRVDTPMGMQEVRQTEWVRFPDRLRQERVLPFGTITLVWNGTSGTVRTPMGEQPVSESQATELRRALARNLFGVAGRRDDPSVQAVAAGREAVGGVECEVLELTADGVTFRLFLDPVSHLPVLQRYTGTGPDGAPAEVTARYADWREVDGVRVAGRIRVEAAGETLAEQVLESFEADPSMPPESLEP